MKKLIISIFFILTFINCCSKPENKYFITKLELHDKKYNIEVFRDTKGGVYATEFIDIYKKDKINDDYSLIRTLEWKNWKLEVKRISGNTIGIIKTDFDGNKDTINLKIE